MTEIEEIKNLLKEQMKPRITVSVEEKVPTEKFGNKTFRASVSFYVENADKEAIKQLLTLCDEAIKEQRHAEGLYTDKELREIAKQKREALEKQGSGIQETFKVSQGEPNMIDQTFKKLGLE